MSAIETEVPPLSAFLRPELPAAALRGLPGDVATALAESSGADPAAVLVTFLALLGNAAAQAVAANPLRKVADPVPGASERGAAMARQMLGHRNEPGEVA